jgi:hypothetical protein
MPGNQLTGLSYGDQQWITFLVSERERLISELEEANELVAEMTEELEEYQEGTKDKTGIMGTIGAVGEQFPWMQEHMSKLLNIFDKLVPARQQQPVNGAPQQGQPVSTLTAADRQAMEAQFGEAVMKLRGYYSAKLGADKGDFQFSQDMAKLANLTDKPMIFDMAINQLKTL